jgi:hypothetical protein
MSNSLYRTSPPREGETVPVSPGSGTRAEDKSGRKTPIHKRPLPIGYQLEWNSEIWNVGFLFSWAEAFGEYVQYSQGITVRPGETPGTALEREGYTDPDYTLFFTSEED